VTSSNITNATQGGWLRRTGRRERWVGAASVTTGAPEGETGCTATARTATGPGATGKGATGTGAAATWRTFWQ
jgi:hypothetical protein